MKRRHAVECLAPTNRSPVVVDNRTLGGHSGDNDDVEFDDKEGQAMVVKIVPITDLRRKTSDVIQAAQEDADAV